MTRARTPTPSNDNVIDATAAAHAALVAALRYPAFVRAFGTVIGAELRRTHGSLQENAAHVGLSESFLSKLIKEGKGPPVTRVSNNCVRIKFADTVSAIENLSSGKGA